MNAVSLIRLFSTLVILALAAALYRPLFADQKATDDQIYDQVRGKLASDRDVKGGAIDVDVHDGVVTLRGKVREEKQKSKAERLARKVKGVKKVVNELQLEPAPTVSSGS